MALVPLEGELAAREPGVLKLSDRQVQQAGVRIGAARVRSLVREIDATGRIVVDERLHATITCWSPGQSRIERLHVNFTGVAVRKGQVLVELYSPAVDIAINEHRIAVKAHESRRNGATGRGAESRLQSSLQLLESSRSRLLRFGLTPEQVTAFGRNDQPSSGVPTVSILSPLSGTVLQRVVEQGQYVREGDPLLHIADLTHLWLYADIYEYELPYVALGQQAEITARSLPGHVFKGEVVFIDPVVQERTRTVRIRCNLANPDALLKPGMYARVQVRSVLPAVLSVPESAVLQSGRRNVVIVSEDGGRFRPKLVRVGRRYLFPTEGETRRSTSNKGAFGAEEERYHEILSGLSAGDRVVVAGNFLLNAEAQFQGTLKKMLAGAEAAERAPKIPEDVRTRLDGVMSRYLSIGSALVADRTNDLRESATAIRRLVQEAAKNLPASGPATLRGLLGRMQTATEALAAGKVGDLDEARKHYASLSREVIAYLRDFAPDRVAGGTLHVFRCPMADDENHRYGYDLWVQEEADIANPYMGPLMPG